MIGLERLRYQVAQRARFWKHHPLSAFLTVLTASVWLVFGIWFKLMGMVPRHRLIVATVLGEAVAGPIVILIGIAETALGLWILSGIKPRWCAIVQSLAIVTMNALELRFARELLLAPGLMVLANTLFLILVWYWALNSRQKQEI